MKKIILLIVLFLNANSIHAHDCHKQIVKCPIDNTEIEFCVVTGSIAYGNYTDFQQQVDMDDFYEGQIKSCPKCHFSGYYYDFSAIYNEKEKKDVLEILSKYNDVKIDDAKECEIAATIKEFFKESNDKIANCYLIGSYVLKKKSKKAVYRKELQKKAAYFLIKAVNNQEYADQAETIAINYLIAEMYRRTGDFKNALKYYDEVLTSKKITAWLEEMAPIQKELAKVKDDTNDI